MFDRGPVIRYFRRVARVPACLLLVLVGCSSGTPPASESEDSLMKSGLEALYTGHDAPAAVDQFPKVLQRNPSHYGATYQLAAALDAEGKRDEATAV